MIYFKEIKTPEEAVAIYKSIQNEVAEFEPNEPVEIWQNLMLKLKRKLLKNFHLNFDIAILRKFAKI